MSTNTKPADFLDKIRIRSNSSNSQRFLLFFLELQIAMGLGALICYLLGRLNFTSSSFAAVYHPGTFLFAAGDIFFLTVPVVAWMNFRGHARQYSLEMAAAMITPVAAIIVLGQLAAYAYLLWLVTAMYPAMSLGILIYMLYRRDHFTGHYAGHQHHAPSLDL